jgi:hypothetical protein
VIRTSGSLFGGAERPPHWDAGKTGVNIMKMKELCDKINNVPTLLAVININGFEKTVCSWAPYDPVKKEVTLFAYHGPADIRRTFMVEESENARKEYVTAIGYNDNIQAGSEVTPYFTEYDFTKPKYLPDWAATVWVKRQKVNIREERAAGKTLADLKKEVHDIDLEIRAEEVIRKLEDASRIRYVKSIAMKGRTKVKRLGH